MGPEANDSTFLLHPACNGYVDGYRAAALALASALVAPRWLTSVSTPDERYALSYNTYICSSDSLSFS